MSHELPVAPVLNERIDNVVIVDGLPVVTPDKRDKLISVVTKVFKELRVVDVDMPMTGDISDGFAFVQFATPVEAQKAAVEFNNYPMTKVNTLTVTLLSDFDRVVSTPDEFVAPALPPYNDDENLYNFMLTPECQDQYVTRVGNLTEIFWNSKKERTLAFKRADWTDSTVRWSPRGTYIATFHQQGIALWGGNSFVRIQRFNHAAVQRAEFSPCERYLVTWSHENDPAKESAIIWDIKTGEKKRGFAVHRPSFPIFRWSHDGKYFARFADTKPGSEESKAGQEAISVFETPSMGLLEKKSIKIPHVQDFAWSPSDNVLAYWVPEDGQIPARISIMSIPDKKDVAVRNVVTVKDCKLYWQENGDYLAVKIDRYEKKTVPYKNGMWECKACKDNKAPKFAFPVEQARCGNRECGAERPEIKYKNEYVQFELFHMRQKVIAYESFPLKDTGVGPILNFAWEPCGNKFALLHGEATRTSANIYQVQSGKVTLVKSLDNIPCNSIYWNPRGQFCVFAGRYSKQSPLQGTMKFVDTVDGSVETVDHFNATDFEWDPTGRYFTSAVSSSIVALDHGYCIWSVYGNPLQKQNVPGFFSLSWRPKMKTMLKPEHHEKIKSNWKEYQTRFEAEDKLFRNKASIEVLTTRRKLKDDWNSKVSAGKQLVQSVADRLRALRPELATRKLEETEEVVETLIKEETETL